MDFNGQIGVSRDLRQNKQTVLGKLDLTDIIFFTIGIISSLLFAYIFGFALKIIDELFAMILSVIPMILVLSLGFRREAGMRYFDFLLMNFINDRSKQRINKANINDILITNKRIIEVKTKKELKSKLLKEKVIDALKVITIKNRVKKANAIRIKNVIDKTILVFYVHECDIERLADRYINQEYVNKIKIKITNINGVKKYIMMLELNYSYKEFLTIYINNEVKDIKIKVTERKINKNKLIPKIETILLDLSKRIVLIKNRAIFKYKESRKYKNKYSKFVNLLSFNRDFIDDKVKNMYDDLAKENVEFIDINNEIISKLDLKNRCVFMLHIYDPDIYDRFINEISIYANVTMFLIKRNEKKYINTFIDFDINDINGKEKITSIANSYNFIFNNLSKEQGLAKGVVSYYMYNPYNAYRKAS